MSVSRLDFAIGLRDASARSGDINARLSKLVRHSLMCPSETSIQRVRATVCSIVV